MGPFIKPILFKTIVYTLLVFVVRLLEPLVRHLFQGSGLSGSLDEILGSFRWDHFIAVQMWVFALFLVYVTATQVNSLFSDGELFKIFFTRQSSKIPVVPARAPLSG
jgi:hypothetical protein